MNVNFSYVFKTFDGDVVEEPYKDGKREVTLRRVACSALIALYQDERDLGAEEKIKRGELARKIATSSDSIDLESEEIALVKKLVGKMFSPLIVYQAAGILEGKDVS